MGRRQPPPASCRARVGCGSDSAKASSVGPPHTGHGGRLRWVSDWPREAHKRPVMHPGGNWPRRRPTRRACFWHRLGGFCGGAAARVARTPRVGRAENWRDGGASLGGLGNGSRMATASSETSPPVPLSQEERGRTVLGQCERSASRSTPLADTASHARPLSSWERGPGGEVSWPAEPSHSRALPPYFTPTRATCPATTVTSSCRPGTRTVYAPAGTRSTRATPSASALALKRSARSST